ncbi:hypothetical protein AND_009954 [Anopheles darlingi]|uniref:Uncharacterized protein n=1 Tax=Anopheles darlingi TaxID=43151 RepID=W5J4X2_ANODA|nr:hypothetical protein AND_009954 [Anopheles darlingi]
MSFEYTEITDPLFVENKQANDEENFIMVRAKDWSDVPIALPNWQPEPHCFSTEFRKYEQDLTDFEVRPDDVWVASYPKSGTTWCQEMVWLICNDLNFEAARAESLRTRFPFLDLIHDINSNSFAKIHEMEGRPRFIKTHLPVSMLPKSYWTAKPKTVYIRRNPKAVGVSYYHHSRRIFYRGTMENFIQSFIHEHHFYSPIHAHVIEYHELRGSDNVLLISYEEMKHELATTHLKGKVNANGFIGRKPFVAMYNRHKITEARRGTLLRHQVGWDTNINHGNSMETCKKVVEEVVEAVEEVDKPAYSEEDLETLVGFIRGMIILFDYEDEDFNDEVAETIKLWLTDANNPLLFIFYDGNRLSASLAFPLCPINDLMYFMREQDQLFNVLEQFHDDILFGTLHGDIEGSLLVLLEQVYGPMILSNVDWSESVKANVINGFNAFMTYLSELHYKLSGFTLLYVPREGSDMEVQEVVLNRSMIKRLEAVVIDWTAQIRATLSDTQHFVPDDLVCPSDEYSFWIYRHEVLSAIRLQYNGPNVQHIVRILELAQSLYIKHLRDVLRDLDKEIEIAESNIPFLKLLVDPCFAIGTLETADDFCSQLIYVMHIIRFIGQDSSYLNKDESMTKLFLYLSNEIVACCMRGIDVDRILSGAPRYGIEICKMKISCCESYKIIYEEMLEHFKSEFTWNLDYAAIFNRINAFLQRLHDILEVCDAMLIFGKYAEGTSYTSYRFFCNNAAEYERRCDQVEKIFHGALATIESVGGTILDINNKHWYRYIGEFRDTLKSLDDIIENLLSNVFLMSENLEEKLNVLVTLLNFYQRESVRESFMRKIGEVWSIFNNEIIQLSKDISAGITVYPALLPSHAGRYAVLRMRFDHLTHLRTLIVNCRFFPEYPKQEEVLALYEACEKQVKFALKGFNESWSKSIPPDMASWYQRNLICRSNVRPGLFEVNIERRLLLLFDEAHYFKILGAPVPMGLDLEKHENTLLTFDNVLRLVLYFNGVISSISDKERLFFKPMIQQTERKLEPLRSKLTWEEDLSEFIDGYVVNVRELLELIELYKRENQKIVDLVERIYGMVFVRLDLGQHPVSMAQLIDGMTEQKQTVLTELVQVMHEISTKIFTVRDSIGSNLRKMSSSWEHYVRKIDKLLTAAIFTCTFNTLRGVHSALENANSNPILLIEILLKQEGTVYEPPVEAVEQTLRRLTDEVCMTIKPVNSMAKYNELDDGERSFYVQLLEHPEYRQICGMIDETIDETVRLLRMYQAKWNVFRPFWCVDKVAFIERFKLSAMTSEAFQTNIEKFEELQNQLSTQGELIVCRCVEIDALKLKYALTSHIAEWQTKYIDYLKCIAYGKIIDFNNVLKSNVEELRHEPKEVYELKRLEERYQACYEELPTKEQEIGTILKYFVVLEKYVADLLPEAYELRHNIDRIWAQYRADLREIREQIDNYQDQFKLSMTGAADALKVDALEMLKMLREEMPTAEELSPGEAFEAIDRLMMQLEVLEQREREIEEKFGVLGVSYPRLPPFNRQQFQRTLAIIYENVVGMSGGAGSLESMKSAGIESVYTRDGECIPLAVPLRAHEEASTRMPRGTVGMMIQLDRSIRDALQDLLPKCHSALRAGYFKRVESGWLRSWPLQLCLKSAELQTTQHTKSALAQCSLLGRKKPLKMLRCMHTKMLEQLTACARQGDDGCEGADERWQRKKLNDLLIVELNARDLIERLYRKPKLHGLQSIEWISQLHSYLDPTSSKCFVQLLETRLSYGYECKRSTEPALLTPTSEKARIAILCTMKSKQIPMLLGKSEANYGRHALLDSLAQSLGVFLRKVSCDRQDQAEDVTRVIIGMRMLGGTGKSVAIRVALKMLEPPCETHRLVPSVLRKLTDPKSFDRIQFDGIVSEALSKGLDPVSTSVRKCLILDSVPSDEWIMGAVQLARHAQYVCRDFTQLYVADGSGRQETASPTQNGNHVKVIVECSSPLDTMTPSAVSHFALVHIGPGDLRWQELIEVWLKSMQHNAFAREWIGELTKQHFGQLLAFRQRECPTVATVNDVALARTFIKLFNSLLSSFDSSKMERNLEEEILRKLFFFCCVWSIGGSLEEDASRGKYDVLMREHHPEAAYPLKGTVFQYHVDLSEVANEFITRNLMMEGAPVLLGSESVAGKTALIENILYTRDHSVWSLLRVVLTKGTTVDQIRGRLQCQALRIMKHRLYPKDRKRMVCFFDDLHTATSNPYAVQEFVRNFCETSGWYEGTSTVSLQQCQMVSAMRLQRCEGPGRSVMQSLFNKCHVLMLTAPIDDELGQIFSTSIVYALEGTTNDSLPKASPVFQLLPLATVDFIGRLTRWLPPTPARPRYQFSLHTIASIVRSVCCVLSEDTEGTYRTDKPTILRLWIHECFRETWDRLERADYKRFNERFNETISDYFEVTLHGLCPNVCPLYGDLFPATDGIEPTDGKNPYVDIRDTSKLIEHAEGKMMSPSASVPSAFIIHREAVEQATKLLRCVRFKRVGMMLVGRPGGGRSVVCELAARLAPSPTAFHRINTADLNEPGQMQQQFLALFRKCLHQRTLAMINLDGLVDGREPNERLMELLNRIVLQEDLSVLFCDNLAPPPLKQSTEGWRTSFPPIDWVKVQHNLHLMLCVPSDGATYRMFSLRYPSLLVALTVNCVHDWPPATLLEISKKYLLKNVPLNVPIRLAAIATGGAPLLAAESSKQKTRTRESLVQSTEERLQIATHDLLFRIHYGAETEVTFLIAGKRNIIAPCSWYFELLHTFERVLREKRLQMQTLHQKYRVGIERILDATAKVASLSEELVERQREIALFQEQLNEFLDQISLQKQEAAIQTEEVSVKRVKIGAEEIVCKQLANVAEADLQRAMPALNAAVSALDSLNKKDMNEIKSYSRPPTKVELVMEAVMILLGKEPTWAESKRQLGEQKFLETLKGFDRNNIAERTLKTIAGYVRNPELEPEKVGTVSKAAKSLMLWVRAIDNYGKVYKYVGPKIRKMEEANASLLEKQNELIAAERKLRELAERLAELQAEYEMKIEEKRKLEEVAREMALKLERARSLVNNLASERVRWTTIKNGLEADYVRLIGDSLLASGCLTYYGPLDIASRTVLFDQWIIDLQTMEAPFTAQFSLTAFFYQPEVLVRWKENGLPPDDFSAENATILLNSTRAPLIVDPQEEAQKWLLAELDDARVVLVDFDDEISEETVVQTFQQHVPFVVENRHFVHVISREPLLLPEHLLKSLNQLSFVLGAEGLEVKMLALLVEHENPSLEERKAELQCTILKNKQTLTDLEERILRILNESTIPLLEDQELYEVLQTSRETDEIVSEELKQAEVARGEIETARDVYQSCAERSALLFLVLGDLQQFNPLYSYSLEWYKMLFLQSLERAGRVQVVNERKRRIDDYHTFNVFR